MFFNLLSNALKFTPKGGFVKLSIEAIEDKVKIEMGDSGPGIHANVGEKFFDKFCKVMNNESLKMGFGIGLYLANSFVALHNGKISFTSNPGLGTIFLIELPFGENEFENENSTFQNELTYVNEFITQE